MDKIYSLLGLCMKAGKLKTGSFKVAESIRDNSACLVLLSYEASLNTKKKFHNMCDFYGVKIAEIGTMEDIRKGIGKSERAVLSVVDDRLAVLVSGQLAENQ